MGPIGTWELILIAVLVVLLFGARRLPEIGRGLGEGIKSFRDAFRTGGGEGGRDKGDGDNASSGGDKP